MSTKKSPPKKQNHKKLPSRREHEKIMAQQLNITPAKSAAIKLGTVLFVLNVIGIFAARWGNDGLVPFLLINTVILLLLGLYVAPGLFLAVFGSIFLLMLVVFPLLGLTLYLLTVLPGIGPALEDQKAWAIAVAIVCVLAIAVVSMPIYYWFERMLLKKFSKKR